MMILFYQGATVEELALLINRTAQSIDKKIDRLRLKPKSTPDYAIKRTRILGNVMSKDDLIEAYEGGLNDLGLIGMNPMDVDLGKLKSDLLEMYPYDITKKKKRSSEEDDIAEINSQWKSLKEIAQFLRGHNKPVKSLADYPRYDHSHEKYGYTHVMGHKALTPAGLLKEANIIRMQQRDTPFYVEGVTFD